MTPQEFISTWRPVKLTERSACQSHFLGLCRLLGQPEPVHSDPEGAWYTFERGVRKVAGGQGFADVWMKGRFGWEYKKRRRNLAEAYNQLLQYREDLENPPLLVVCDMDRIEVHTNFTGTPKKIYAFTLDDLNEPEALDVLRKVFTDPDSLKPGQTVEAVTEKVADVFHDIADGMRARGEEAHAVAHFLMKLVFCLFAEDVNLLPAQLFTRLLSKFTRSGAGQHYSPGAGPRLSERLASLFEAMSKGGDFGADSIFYFNGGLFADADVIDLTDAEIEKLASVAIPDWSGVEPSIFGTLFERLLDPDKRRQIGANYTSRRDIETLLEPVLMQPLRTEWSSIKVRAEALVPEIQHEVAKREQTGILLDRYDRKRKRTPRASKKTRLSALEQFEDLILGFQDRLSKVTVLDPACGSGNFLYVALRLLLTLEKEVMIYAARFRTQLGLLPQVRPTQLAGLEKNTYAHELASVVIWIGYLQWMRDNGFQPRSNPVLEPMRSIVHMDAILDNSNTDNPREPEWPVADVIVGNPPFAGGRKLRRNMGDTEVDALFGVYKGRVAKSADLCCYWFEKANDAIRKGRCKRAGLLGTQAIRGGASRKTIDRICRDGSIFFAVSDQEWLLDGAMVHISMVGFDDGAEKSRVLDGVPRTGPIYSSLSAGVETTRATRLPENRRIAFQGVTPMGPFDIPEALALDFLSSGRNPNGRPNSDVIRHWANGLDLIEARSEQWVIDFESVSHAAFESAVQYERPFEYVRENVLPARQGGETEEAVATYWKHWRPRPKLRSALAELNAERYLVTPRVGKHRLCIWVASDWLPSDATVAFARADDFTFGVLQSRVHAEWIYAPGMGTQVRERESGFRYTPTTCFETFPFPEATDGQRSEIAAAAHELNQLRDTWLNPPELVRTEIISFPGSVGGPWGRFIEPTEPRDGSQSPQIGTVRYPRLIARDEASASMLAVRTLTNLYNERPTWLSVAHQRLDDAVFAAYGWPSDISTSELLDRLLSLNLSRSS